MRIPVGRTVPWRWIQEQTAVSVQSVGFEQNWRKGRTLWIHEHRRFLVWYQMDRTQHESSSIWWVEKETSAHWKRSLIGILPDFYLQLFRLQAKSVPLRRWNGWTVSQKTSCTPFDFATSAIVTPITTPTGSQCRVNDRICCSGFSKKAIPTGRQS